MGVLVNLKPQVIQTPTLMHRVLIHLMASSLSGISRRRLAALAASAAVLSPAYAQEAEKTGQIEGRVFNALTGSYLNNARVSVEGTSLQVFTDDSGSYLIRNVPAGAVKVKISYTGQEDIIQAVTVAADATAKFDATFGSSTTDGGVVLDPFVIQAARYRNAQELAINEERSATNIKSVVALDSLGFVADGNIGEFVRYLPGVDLGEGGDFNNPTNATSVGVRGFGASDTVITIDGMPIASGSPSNLTRTAQLDGISVNNGSRLEIIKVATPDMPQDAPGGTINLITRGAFEVRKPQYEVTVALNGNTNTPDVFKKQQGPGGPVYATRPSIRVAATIPISSKLGFSVSASNDSKYTLFFGANPRDWDYVNRTTTANGGSVSTTNPAIDVVNASGQRVSLANPILRRYEALEQQWVDDRQSGSLRVDWKPLPSLVERASGNFSMFESQVAKRRTQWEFQNNSKDVIDWGDGFVRSRQRTSSYATNLGREMNVDAIDKEGFTSQGQLSVAYKKGPWKIDLKGSASESYHSLPDTKNGHFSTVSFNGQTGRMSFEGINEGVPSQILVWDNNGNPIDYSRLGAWGSINTGNEFRSSTSYSRDLVKLYNVDVQRELDFLPFPVTLKTGLQMREKSAHKWGRGATYRMIYTGPAIAADQFESDFYTEPKYGYAGKQYWADPYKLYDFYEANPHLFSDSARLDVPGFTNADYAINNYLSKVANTKGITNTDTDLYGMLTATFMDNRLTVVTGARKQRKEAEGYNVFNDPRFNLVKAADGSVYRDSIYTQGVRFDGGANSGVLAGGSAAYDAVLTDTALRARMQAAGVQYLPNELSLGYLVNSGGVLVPGGGGVRRGTGSSSNNMRLAMLNRSTREVNTENKGVWQPQVQLAFEATETIKLQVAYSKETRLPDLESTNNNPNGMLVTGASFQINENTTPGDPTVDGSDGSINVSNVKNTPEINHSWNFKLGYYPSWGRYSVSYYYKFVQNTWLSETIYRDDPIYDDVISSMGLDPAEYDNYSITTTTLNGGKSIRRGLELEAYQNLGFLGSWARNMDVFVTYTRRPTVARQPNTALGFTRLDPVRAKYTGGLTFSTARFSFLTKWTYVEAKRTFQSNQTVHLPETGLTNQSVTLYNLNKNPATVSVQLNYILNKNIKFFASANKVLETTTQSRIADALTGYMPDWSTYRQLSDRGVAISAGVISSF